MVFESFSNVRAFQGKVLDMLLAREVENNLMIGLLDRGAESLDTDGWFMARIADGQGHTALAALMTPLHNLILVGAEGAVSEAALARLDEALAQRHITVPGVIAETELARAFTEAYTASREQTWKNQTLERIYRLDAVADVPLTGTLRAAETRDLHYLPYWHKGFVDECFRTVNPLDAEHAMQYIHNGTLYILEVGGQPVSMAGSTRRMPHGRSVGPVYTPPYMRGRGYATACVAMLSRRILASGSDYCVLFTDLSNPTSNHIYQTIGYRPLSDVAEIRFTDPVDAPDEGRDAR